MSLAPLLADTVACECPYYTRAYFDQSDTMAMMHYDLALLHESEVSGEIPPTQALQFVPANGPAPLALLRALHAHAAPHGVALWQ